MPRFVTLALLSIGLIAPAAAQQAPAKSDAETLKNARQAIETADKAYVDALMKKDAGGVTALFTKDAVILSSGLPAIAGGDVRAFWDTAVKAEYTDYQMKVADVRLEAEDTALATGQWTASRKDEKGSTLEQGGDFAQLWHRDGDSWKIRFASWNVIPERAIGAPAASGSSAPAKGEPRRGGK